MDQNKPFDRVNPFSIPWIWKASGFWSDLPFIVATAVQSGCCLVVVGGALSCPLEVYGDIKQECGSLRQFYYITAETFLYDAALGCQELHFYGCLISPLVLLPFV